MNRVHLLLLTGGALLAIALVLARVPTFDYEGSFLLRCGSVLSPRRTISCAPSLNRRLIVVLIAAIIGLAFMIAAWLVARERSHVDR